MSTTPSPLVITPELEKQLAASLDPETMKALVQTEIERQAGEKVRLDAEQAAAEKTRVDQAAADAAATTDSPFSCDEVIGGRQFHFDASSELELAQLRLNAHRVADSLREPTETTQVQQTQDYRPTQAEIEADAAARAAAKADLELKFKRGEIDTAAYLEQSGAMDEYLEKRGISVQTLKDVVENVNSNAERQSWAEATAQFLNSPGGEDWPGDNINLEILGNRLASMGLENAEDKQSALTKAWNAMKQEKMYVPYEQTEGGKTAIAAEAAARAAETRTLTPAEQVAVAAQKVVADAAAAKSAADTAAAADAAQRTPSRSSSLFGQSSGVMGSVGAAERAVAPQFKVPDNASPAEILEAWKQAQLASGVSPDEAFKQTFSGRK